MSIQSLTQTFPWSRYSKKLAAKIDNPRCAGFFNKAESEERHMRLVEACSGSVQEGNAVLLNWLVDPEDGVIVDAKHQVFGQSALIGAAELSCELSIGKNYDQVKRITAELIDKQARDRADEQAIPNEAMPLVSLVIDAMRRAAEQCQDLPLAASYVAPPVPTGPGEVLEGGYPGWEELTVERKISVVEQVLDQDVRPYIALDAGGVKVLNLIGNDLIITYEGTCTSCYSSIGATLSYIQQTIRAKVHPSLNVVPELPVME